MLCVCVCVKAMKYKIMTWMPWWVHLIVLRRHPGLSSAKVFASIETMRITYEIYVCPCPQAHVHVQVVTAEWTLLLCHPLSSWTSWEAWGNTFLMEGTIHEPSEKHKNTWCVWDTIEWLIGSASWLLGWSHNSLTSPHAWPKWGNRQMGSEAQYNSKSIVDLVTCSFS